MFISSTRNLAHTPFGFALILLQTGMQAFRVRRRTLTYTMHSAERYRAIAAIALVL